jgi:hypothetical protein
MIADEIRTVLKKRSETDDEWTYGVEQCWQKEIEILSRNMDETISFLENDCTADEFSWLSEVFDDVAEKTQSRLFVDALHRVARKFPEECKKYYIDRVLQYADGALLDAD